MQFPTGLFALFFATVFALHWALRRHPVADRLVLLGASLVFYGAWDWRFCFLLVGVALWAWVFGLVLGARPRGRAGIMLPLAVAGPLLVLAYFKYAGFFVAENMRMAADQLGGDGRDDVAEGEHFLFFGHAGVKHDLK